MKIYILLDTYLNMEQHCDFIDVFDDADELLKYIEKNQSDGHKFEIHTKEVKEHPFVSPTSPDSTGYRTSVVKCTQVSKSGTDSVNSESYDGIR